MSGYFSGFSSPLGDREDRHLVLLAEIEAGGADQIAHVLDKEDASFIGGQLVTGVVDHFGVQMTALAGVDLHGRHASGTNAIRIGAGLLIPFDHGAGAFFGQQAQGFAQQGGFA